jgi:hypothetical protein
VPGTRTLKLSEQASLMAVGFEGKVPARICGAGCSSRSPRPAAPSPSPTAAPRRPALYQVTLNMLCPIGSVVIKEWNAAALP